MNKSRERNIVSIKEAIIAVTYRCNSRCRMCGIWKINEHENEFAPAQLEKLPKTLTDVNITGGEPFLRKDLTEIVKVLTRNLPKASIIISSNGFATQLIADRMKEILEINPKIGVVFSLDGIGKCHNKIRGIDKGFEKVMETFRQLRLLGCKNLKFGYTIGDYNFLELKKVYGLCKQLGVEMSFTLVHSSDNYFGQQNQIFRKDRMVHEIRWLIQQELKHWNLRRWARAFYAYGMMQFLLENERVLPDYSGQLSVFIDPKGNIFPCDVSSRKIGKLENFSQLERVGTDECQKTWMMCTVRQSIKKHKLKVIGWIALNKSKQILKCNKQKGVFA